MSNKPVVERIVYAVLDNGRAVALYADRPSANIGLQRISGEDKKSQAIQARYQVMPMDVVKFEADHTIRIEKDGKKF